MTDLQELYQQVILDHSKHPRNSRSIDCASGQAQGYNPLCGDRVTIYLLLENDVVSDVSFTGSACAICTASASMMTQFLKGKSVKQVDAVFAKFHELLTGTIDAEVVLEDLDKLTVFSGVKRFPMRVKCATLPWHTMKAALENQQRLVSTE